MHTICEVISLNINECIAKSMLKYVFDSKTLKKQTTIAVCWRLLGTYNFVLRFAMASQQHEFHDDGGHDLWCSGNLKSYGLRFALPSLTPKHICLCSPGIVWLCAIDMAVTKIRQLPVLLLCKNLFNSI